MHYLTRITRIALIGIGVLCLASGQIVPGFAQPAQAQANAQGVNGWNVIRATFDGGVFQQTAPGQWTEFGNSGQNFYFEERNRDDWSVYLHDVSRDISIQIDIPEDQDIYKPSASRLVYIAIVDVLAAGAARKRPERVKENLRRIRTSLVTLSEDSEPKPIGD